MVYIYIYICFNDYGLYKVYYVFNCETKSKRAWQLDIIVLSSLPLDLHPF